MILLLLLIGSVLMICLGIIGYYIAKIYEEVKDRPRYILSDTCGRRAMLKKIFDPTLFRFLLVGVVNTLVGYGVMFGLYNLAGLHLWGDPGYWISSAANYLVGSVVSFFLNKHFTFRSREKGPRRGAPLRGQYHSMLAAGLRPGQARHGALLSGTALSPSFRAT